MFVPAIYCGARCNREAVMGYHKGRTLTLEDAMKSGRRFRIAEDRSNYVLRPDVNRDFGKAFIDIELFADRLSRYDNELIPVIVGYPYTIEPCTVRLYERINGNGEIVLVAKGGEMLDYKQKKLVLSNNCQDTQEIPNARSFEFDLDRWKFL